MTHWISANWPAPARVYAGTTLRTGGVSQGVFSSLNLATHVDDTLAHVLANRARVKHELALPTDPVWLNQTHTAHVVCADKISQLTEADASYTQKKQCVCAVLTADCLPILLCDTQGNSVAAVHAGWRGLAEGILSKAVQRFHDSSQVIAWLGPAISQKHFEVGEDVYQAFVAQQPQASKAFVSVSGTNKWMADIYLLARLQLNAAGIEQVYGGDFCTYADAEHFYSYRRDGKQSGRMASLIWKASAKH